MTNQPANIAVPPAAPSSRISPRPSAAPVYTETVQSRISFEDVTVSAERQKREDLRERTHLTKGKEAETVAVAMEKKDKKKRSTR
eukprot:1506218-Pleurochrysis_carterae.AAC.1